MKELVCYCFQHTQEDLEQDVRTHGKSTIMEQIMASSRDGKCNCKINNPKQR